MKFIAPSKLILYFADASQNKGKQMIAVLESTMILLVLCIFFDSKALISRLVTCARRPKVYASVFSFSLGTDILT